MEELRHCILATVFVFSSDENEPRKVYILHRADSLPALVRAIRARLGLRLARASPRWSIALTDPNDNDRRLTSDEFQRLVASARRRPAPSIVEITATVRACI